MSDENVQNEDGGSPPDETPKEAPIIPLQIIQGAKPDAALETRTPLPDDAKLIAELDGQLATVLIRLAKVEIQIGEILQQHAGPQLQEKQGLIAQAREIQRTLGAEAVKAALRVGIDPPRTPGTWQYDQGTRMFKRIS
jgi:hypothetical protein